MFVMTVHCIDDLLAGPRSHITGASVSWITIAGWNIAATAFPQANSLLFPMCILRTCHCMRKLPDAGSGRSFTAYVFSKAQHAQQAQRDPLSDVTAVQPISPQPLAAPRAVAESPSPPPAAEAIVSAKACSVSKQNQTGAAVIHVQPHCAEAVTGRHSIRNVTVSSHSIRITPTATAGMLCSTAGIPLCIASGLNAACMAFSGHANDSCGCGLRAWS